MITVPTLADYLLLVISGLLDADVFELVLTSSLEGLLFTITPPAFDLVIGLEDDYILDVDGMVLFYYVVCWEVLDATVDLGKFG